MTSKIFTLHVHIKECTVNVTVDYKKSLTLDAKHLPKFKSSSSDFTQSPNYSFGISLRDKWV